MEMFIDNYLIAQICASVFDRKQCFHVVLR